jgi:hypothetical protein
MKNSNKKVKEKNKIETITKGFQFLDLAPTGVQTSTLTGFVSKASKNIASVATFTQIITNTTTKSQISL